MAGELNSYFLPGYGISRAVIQSEIRYHCGPDAIVRPYTHQVCKFGNSKYSVTDAAQGRDGFLVTTAGPPLTQVCKSHTLWRTRTLT